MISFIERQKLMNERLASLITRVDNLGSYLRGTLPPQEKSDISAVPDGTLNQLEYWQQEVSHMIGQLSSSLDFVESCIMPSPTPDSPATGRTR